MKKVFNWVHTIIKVLTVILSIFTIVEAIKAWQYKRKLARKAQEYLEDEFIPEENMSNTLNVYSPTIKTNRNRVTALLAATGVGCVLLIICNVLKLGRD